MGFKNQREVIAHLAGGGKIKNEHRIIYMNNEGNVYIEGKDGDSRIILDNFAHAWSEIYVEPNKYAVDVWFKEHPSPVLFNDGKIAFIFGQSTEWNSTYSSGYNKKYRITVEEVRE